MAEVVTPHLKVPFQWGADGHAQVVEQNSVEDVTQCVFAVLNTRLGFRLEIPTFGLRKQILTENGPSLTQIEAAVLEWEPRASYILTTGQLQDILSRYVNVALERKANG